MAAEVHYVYKLNKDNSIALITLDEIKAAFLEGRPIIVCDDVRSDYCTVVYVNDYCIETTRGQYKPATSLPE